MKGLNVRTILIIVIFITSLSVMFQDLYFLLSLFGIGLILLIIKEKSRFFNKLISLKRTIKLIIILFIFQIVFRRGGQPLVYFGIFKITTEGIIYGITSSLRITLILIAALLLSDRTYKEYLSAFNAWKIPYEIAFLISTVIFFIPMFSKEIKKAKEALLIRGIDFKTLSLKKRLSLFTELVFPVLTKALHDIKIQAASMDLRAFRLNNCRTYLYGNKLSKNDLIIQTIVLIAFVTIIIFKLSI